MSVATASILAPRTAKPFPESRQGVSAFSFADMHHRAAFQVQHERHVAMSLADGNLVDGDLPQVFQLGLGEPPLQVLLLRCP